MKVLFTTNLTSPYRVDFFNELSKLCELTVLFERKTAKSRNDDWMTQNTFNFNAIFMNGTNMGDSEAFCPEIIKYLKNEKYDIVVIGLYSSLTSMLAIEYLRYRHIPFILSSDGAKIKDDFCIKYRMKRHFISSAAAWLSTGKGTTEYFKHYGADEKNIHIYPFTSIREKNVLKKATNKEEKNILRQKLGITEDKVVISVGRYIPVKGFDILMKASKNLDKNIGVYIIGGKPTDEYLKLKERLELTNVHFVDFMSQKELADYYKAADLFILITRGDAWGLVVNEAMAYGLPVLTTDKCGAAPEMIRGNGKICPLDAEWAREITDLLNNENICQMAEKSIEIASEYTIENMARVHYAIFSEILKER